MKGNYERNKFLNPLMIFLMKWLSRSRTGPRRTIWNPFQRAYRSRGMFLLPICVSEHSDSAAYRHWGINE